MSIFETLKNAILGTHGHPAAGPAASRNQASPAPQAGSPAGLRPATAPAQPAPAQGMTGATPAAPVDIDAVLNQKAAQKHEKLNWRSSIVDLMKLVDMDSSLENRKALAKELGYSGDTQDSASMNVWLHKEVMQKLAASGGKLPDSIRH
jgi:hypothetical protein